jgi:hypothetical protein
MESFDNSQYTTFPIKRLSGLSTKPDLSGLLYLTHEYAKLFNNPVDLGSTIRQVGNVSVKRDNKVFISCTNTNKLTLTEKQMVEVYLDNDVIYYYGSRPPSIDTCIHLLLYKKLPKIRYILHTHGFLKKAKTTKVEYPAGVVEEVYEVEKLISDTNQTEYFVNVKGHGSLAMVKHLDSLRDLPFKL